MTRRIISESALLKILNDELHKLPDSRDYRFNLGVTRLVQPDESGCNWSNATLRGSGAPVSIMLDDADIIITEARQLYNLDDI